MEITNRIVYLLHKHIRQELDEHEATELTTWAGSHPAFQQLLDEVSDEKGLTSALIAFDQVYGGDQAASIARMERRIADGMQVVTEGSTEPTRFRRLRKWLPYAAALLIATSVVTYFFLEGGSNQEPKIVDLKTEDIAPGGHRATLTLADGQTIDLSEEQAGIKIGDRITYLDGSAVLEQGEGTKKQEKGGPHGTEKDKLTTNYYVLTTPNGGTYQLTLADGSKVWLNAASTLKYPSHFDNNERIVELEGEGYFEVAKDTKRPFKVRSKGQEVEVLGTEFNVSAYPDEDATKTTLVEGEVRLLADATGANVMLAPSEQGSLVNDVIDVRKVKTELFTAWKDGFFYFDRLPTRAALGQLARWYDLELIYEGQLKKMNMFAYIKRDKPLSAVLTSLEKSGLKFKVTQAGEQKQLIVLGEQR
ncbi:FecR family protein [Parapedobacter soli]|uniref:FecR family protein n=1 Tax=Parapedobacter soli TaxID=416955 RepID=UPI0021C9C4FF|nr:FecR family protein [Parapedobacter soli]